MSKTIVCMNYQENPIPGCMYAVHQNGRVVASGQADGEGRATITETISSMSPTKIYFWPSERQIEAAYETDTFLWGEERNLLGLRAPEEYTIPLRRTDNIAEEPANYMQKWHRVEQGDTLYSIANKYGTTVDALKIRNNLQTDIIAIGQQLLLPSTATRPTPNNTPTQPSMPQTEPQTPSPTPSAPPQGEDDLGDFIENLPEDGQTAEMPPTPAERPVPPATPPTEQPQPRPSPQTPPATNNGNTQIEQDRSAQTGRPESVASNPNECWCDRDFTLNELKAIITQMRQTERMRDTSIFSDRNCPLPESDRTYDRLLTEINQVCNRYQINTCIRKAHFLSQVYWEAARMTTTLEFATGNAYNPRQRADASANGNTNDGDGPRYRGRGLMQLTWRKNYKRYFSYLCRNNPEIFARYNIPANRLSAESLLNRSNVFSEPKSQQLFNQMISVDYAGLVANDLHFAVDSAGWFWVNGVVLRNGNALSLNGLADEGDVKQRRISQLVNGGGNGSTERHNYYFALKDTVMNIPRRCRNFRR